MAGVSDDLCFLAVILGVEDAAGDLGAFEHFADQLGCVHGCGADEYGLATVIGFLDLADYGIVFLTAGLEHLVILVNADVRHIGGNGQNVEFVDVVEFGGLGLSCSGHAGELLIETEVVLNGDGGVGLSFLLNVRALFGFYCLVQAV